MRQWAGPARSLTRLHRRRLKSAPLNRCASTAIQLTPSEAPAPSNTLLLLEDLQSLLQRDFAGLEIWKGRLRRGVEDLHLSRRKRIGIWGGEFSGRTDVVAALAQDALESSANIRQLLRNRETRIDQSSMSIGCEPVDDVVVSSPWLQSLNLHILEITDEDPSTALSQLFQCDIVALVVNPFILAADIPSTLLSLFRTPAHIVVNGALPPDMSEAALVAKLNRQGIPTSCVSFVRADDALAAIDSFNEPQTSAHTLDVFQQRYTSSGIGMLQRAIASNIPNQEASAVRLADAALSAVGETVALDVEMNAVFEGRGIKLERESSEASLDGADFTESVTRAIASARQELDRGFTSRWTWLNLVLKARIDDCGREAAEVIRRLIGDDLGAQLAFELGKIDQRQSQWTQKADQILREAIQAERGPSSSTANALAVLSRSSSHTETRSLIAPPYRQFLPLVTRLQRSAERAALGMWTLGFSSVGASWAASSLELVSSTNAVTGSVLGILLSLRMGQQLWHRAQRRFRRDWDRLAVLTAEDLTSRITTLADATVTARPKAVSRALINMAQSRGIRLRAVQDRVQRLRGELVHVDRGMHK